MDNQPKDNPECRKCQHCKLASVELHYKEPYCHHKSLGSPFMIGITFRRPHWCPLFPNHAELTDQRAFPGDKTDNHRLNK